MLQLNERREAEELVLRLGHSLHRHGAPAHRLEQTMEAVATGLGLEGHFFSSPTAILASFEAPAGPRSYLERVSPGDHDLERRGDLTALADQIAAGQADVLSALDRLDAIDAAPRRYAAAVVVFASAAASAAAAILFSASLWGVAIATLSGGAVGALAHALSSPGMFMPVAAFVAAVAAFALVPDAGAANVVTIAGLIAIVPGLTLTVALTELATGHLLSGVARFAAAMTGFLQIALGVAIGRHVGQHAAVIALGLDVPTLVASGPSAEFVAITVAGLAFTVLLRARPRDVGWVVLAGFIGVGGVQLGTLLIGDRLGPFIGGLAVGVAGNLYERWRLRSS